MKSCPTTYQDANGSVSTTLQTDGKSLRIEIRDVVFEGEDLDSLSPVADTKPQSLQQFKIHQECLCDCRFDVEISIQVTTPNGFEDGLIKAWLDLGKPSSEGGLEDEVVRLRLKFRDQEFQSTGKSGWFEDELLELEKQLPLGCHMRLCITCAFSDYSPYGHGMFGCLACFRGNKAEYSQVKSKGDMFRVWGTLTEYSKRHTFVKNTNCESPEQVIEAKLMIPRKILKIIRLVGIRTNRPVSKTLADFGTGDRARPGRSQRRPRRWPRGARAQTDSLVPRRNVRREGAPNRSRGGCAPRDSALRIPRSAFL